MFPDGSSMWMLSIFPRLLSMQCALLSIVFCLLSCPNACCQFSIGCGQLLCFLFSCSVRLARSPLTFAHRDFHGNLRSPTLECSRKPNHRPICSPTKAEKEEYCTGPALLYIASLFGKHHPITTCNGNAAAETRTTLYNTARMNLLDKGWHATH